MRWEAPEVLGTSTRLLWKTRLHQRGPLVYVDCLGFLQLRCAERAPGERGDGADARRFRRLDVPCEVPTATVSSAAGVIRPTPGLFLFTNVVERLYEK
jgi:hypothetical protein